MELSREHLLDVLKIIFKWKKPIIITCIAIALLTAIISLIIPVYYKGVTVFYAASPSLQSPAAIFGESSKDLEFYGESEDIDRILQCANSKELTDFMVNTFNLYEHYDINPENIKAPYLVALKFSKHFDIEKNERDAIELKIEDKDRELSAKMTNAARDKIDELARNLIQETQKNIISSYEQQIKQKEMALSNISDSLSVLRQKYNIFDAKTQKEFLAENIPLLEGNIAADKVALAKYKNIGRKDSIRVISARIETNENKLNALTHKNGENLSKAISQVDQLSQVELVLMEELGEDKSKYERYKSAVSVSKPAIFVQDIAEIPVIKSRPKRTLLVVGATFLAFFFSIISVLLIEYNRDIDWKEIVNAK